MSEPKKDQKGDATPTKDKKGSEEDKKKVAEEAIDELSESDDETDETPADKVGFLEIAEKKPEKFKTRYAILNGGSLFLYKDAQDAKPAKPGIGLKKLKLNKKPDGVKKDYAFSLTGGDKEVYYFAVYSHKDLDGWLTAIEKNSSMDETEPPERVVQKKEKAGIFARSKNAMAGNIATSGLGKKVIKSILNEETSALLDAVKKIVAKEASKKKAEEIEKSIIKITVKAYLLTQNGKIENDAFLSADKPLRQAFELLIKCFNGRGRVRPDQIEGALVKAEGFFKQAEQTIVSLLASHMSAKNNFRLAQTFGYLGSADFLKKAYADDSMESELEKLIDAMEYYTQFHYN